MWDYSVSLKLSFMMQDGLVSQEEYLCVTYMYDYAMSSTIWTYLNASLEIRVMYDSQTEIEPSSVTYNFRGKTVE